MRYFSFKTDNIQEQQLKTLRIEEQNKSVEGHTDGILHS